MTSLRRRTILTALLAGGAMTACTDQGEDRTPDASDGGGGDTKADTPDPGTAVATAELILLHTEVTVGVHPLVRNGEHLVMTLDLSAEAGSSDDDGGAPHDGAELVELTAQQWADGWGSHSGDSRHYLGVRLLDLAEDQVASTAVDADGQSVAISAGTGGSGASDGGGSSAPKLLATVQIAYADPGADALTVYIPKIPVFADVPVVEAGVPEVAGAKEQLDLSRIHAAPLAPMRSMSEDFEHPIREQREKKTTTVAISSDVLFDSSSATLDSKAENALDEAARRIESHEAGPVTVTGHTDSVDTEKFNLALSKKRAQAVADALAKRLDTDDYQLSTDGKGESEPIASNDNPEGKALNRRVEISLRTPVKSENTESGTMPKFAGKSAPAEEGVSFDGSEHEVIRPFELQLKSARMLAEHLVVTLEVTPQDEQRNGAQGIGQFDEGTDMPEEPDGVSNLALLGSCGAIGVVVGSTITYPALHGAGGPTKTVRPLTDLSLNSAADGGVPRILELVYPRDIAGVEDGAEIALQFGGTSSLDYANENGWRLTDVPVAS